MLGLPEGDLETTMLLAQLEQDLLTAGDPCSTGLQCEVGGGDRVQDDLHEAMANLVQCVDSHVGGRGDESEQVQHQSCHVWSDQMLYQLCLAACHGSHPAVAAARLKL